MIKFYLTDSSHDYRYNQQYGLFFINAKPKYHHEEEAVETRWNEANDDSANGQRMFVVESSRNDIGQYNKDTGQQKYTNNYNL